MRRQTWIRRARRSKSSRRSSSDSYRDDSFVSLAFSRLEERQVLTGGFRGAISTAVGMSTPLLAPQPTPVVEAPVSLAPAGNLNVNTGPATEPIGATASSAVMLNAPALPRGPAGPSAFSQLSIGPGELLDSPTLSLRSSLGPANAGPGTGGGTVLRVDDATGSNRALPTTHGLVSDAPLEAVLLGGNWQLINEIVGPGSSTADPSFSGQSTRAGQGFPTLGSENAPTDSGSGGRTAGKASAGPGTGSAIGGGVTAPPGINGGAPIRSPFSSIPGGNQITSVGNSTPDSSTSSGSDVGQTQRGVTGTSVGNSTSETASSAPDGASPASDSIGGSGLLADAGSTAATAFSTAVGAPRSVEGQTSHVADTGVGGSEAAEAGRAGSLTIAFSTPAAANQVGSTSIITEVPGGDDLLLALNFETDSEAADAQVEGADAEDASQGAAAAESQSPGIVPEHSAEAQDLVAADGSQVSRPAGSGDTPAAAWDVRERALLDAYVQQQHAAAREQGAELLALNLADDEDIIIDLEAVDPNEASELADAGAGAAPRLDSPWLADAHRDHLAGDPLVSPEVVGGVVLVAGGVAARGLQNRRHGHIDELMSRFRNRSLLAACRLNRLR